MRKTVSIVMLFLLLSGCSGSNDGFDRAMDLRTSLLQGSGCSFTTEITADFGDRTYSFSMDCVADAEGTVTFSVQEPEYICGISGNLEQQSGRLTFDDTALAFPLQGEGVLSPISGPWIMLTALRSGHVRSCAQENGLLRMTVNDSYENDALMLDIWLDAAAGPVRADIYEENQRIMSLSVKNFRIL